jgi:steroid delta-isomerase-like uncharacterized protein
MTREQAEALFARRQAAFNRLDAAALAADHASDGVVESPTAAGTVSGREAIADVYRAWFKAFPDFEFRHIELVVEGDRVALVATASGTNAAGFMGLPATGKRFKFPVVCVYRFEASEIVHEQRVYDFSGMLIQIGMLKAKPA